MIDALDLMSPKRYGASGVPHAVWTEMRRDDPVQFCEPDGFEPFWAVTKHADIMEISAQPDVFCNGQGMTVLTSAQAKAVRDGKSGFDQMRTIIQMDPPEHRLYRKFASGFFTPKGIDRLDEIVTTTARTLLDSLGDEGDCDIVQTIAQRHPLRVLATILGIDRDDEERVLELTNQLFSGDDPDYQRPAANRGEAQQALAMDFYFLFDRIIQDRRANPRADLATMLATAMLPNGEPLGPVETFGYYLIVFSAGHDTTRNALSGAFDAFVRHPEQLKRITENPGMVKNAVEEVVRWSTPVNYMRRTALRDYELRGHTIKEGEKLALFYASANRDEDVFVDPFTFDVNRHPNPHLGFGWAEHFCLGAHLARASIKAMISELAARVEVLEPTGPAVQTASNFVVGLKSLPVHYRLRSGARPAA